MNLGPFSDGPATECNLKYTLCKSNCLIIQIYIKSILLLAKYHKHANILLLAQLHVLPVSFGGLFHGVVPANGASICLDAPTPTFLVLKDTFVTGRRSVALNPVR